MTEQAKHWDKIFQSTKTPELGWFDAENQQLKDYISRTQIPEPAKIFFAGAGTSSLVQDLAKLNAELVINDISSIALDELKQALKGSKSSNHWLLQDISQPICNQYGDLDLWIDRAVLHFLHEEEAIKGYFDNLFNLLKPKGYALFAEFSKHGATQCAGLPINRYSLDMFEKRLPNFSLVDSGEFLYSNSKGMERPYIIAMYQKD